MAQEFNLFEDFAPYEEQQFTFNSAITQHQKISSSEIPAPSKKIVDFGKKIGGARKDMFAYWREKFLDYTQDNIARQPFSKTWPMLPYQKLVDDGENPEKVAVLRVIRDLFSDKPRKRYAIPRWATNVFAMRELAIRILNGEPYDNALDAVRSRDDLTFQIELYEKFGHKNSFKGFYFEYFDSVVWKGEKYSNIYAVCNEKGKYWSHHILAVGNTKEEAVNACITSLEQQETKSSGKESIQTSIERRRLRYFVGSYRIEKNTFYVFRRPTKGRPEKVSDAFKNAEEASDWLEKNWRSIEEKRMSEEASLKALRDTLNERSGDNSLRIGPARRVGDVSPEMFMETFGFYGVEFGNYVEDKLRQSRLNETYDAFCDLSEVLKIPAHAISLGGQLGLGFGSRGVGGKHAAAAHYEPGMRPVINLTKKKGAGCLAHEWFHALDNYLGKLSHATNSIAFVTHIVKRESTLVQDLPIPIMEAIKSFHATRFDTEYYKRSCALNNVSNRGDYWSKGTEMGARAFERYVKDKLAELGIQNDFLVKFHDKAEWEQMYSNSPLSKFSSSIYPYPLPEEMPRFKEAFDNLNNAIIECIPEMRYSAIGNTKQLLSQSRILRNEDLTVNELNSIKMAEDGLGIKLAYIVGPKELHGKYDPLTDTVYVNRSSEVNPEWVFWHESIHALRRNHEELYDDLMRHIESSEAFTREQLNAYRNKVKQPTLSDIRVKEEMLADVFADIKTQAKFLSSSSKSAPSLAHRIVRYAKGMLNSCESTSTLSETQLLALKQRITKLSSQVDSIRLKQGFSQNDNILKDNVVHFFPDNHEIVNSMKKRCLLELQAASRFNGLILGRN